VLLQEIADEKPPLQTQDPCSAGDDLDVEGREVEGFTVCPVSVTPDSISDINLPIVKIFWFLGSRFSATNAETLW
jgi:hypothetical protein